MKILYFGTICDIKVYENILEKCKSKPSVATIVFESSLLKGFYKNGEDVSVYSYPMIPAFPDCSIKKWGRVKNELDCGYTCTWLKTINIPILKQISRKLDGRKVLKNWINNNREEELVVLSYGFAPFLTRDIISICKKHGVKSCAIVPDLPRDMYMNSDAQSLKTKLRHLYLKPTLKVQGQYDGYVYLTKAMSDVINKNKPYTVVEGILNETSASFTISESSTKRSIMYAGALNEKFGVINLIDAFEKFSLPDTELWLFGDGNAVDKIKKRAAKNSNIRFFGRKNREEVLAYEQKATLLINPRNCKDDYTKYSFPSKTIEYMYSGTPLLTTKLQGIPEEYYNYVFSSEDNSVDSLAKSLKNIFAHTDSELAGIGNKAKEFVANNKNSFVQSKRILSFLKSLNGSN